MSTIVSMCSTPTGHSCTHAPHVRQSQSASSCTQPPISGRGSGPDSSTCSLRFSTMCIGESTFSVRFAGQLSVHRPQTAQAKPSRSSFWVNSDAFDAPKLSAVSRSGVDSVPLASSDRIRKLSGDATMCMCFERGM